MLEGRRCNKSKNTFKQKKKGKTMHTIEFFSLINKREKY